MSLLLHGLLALLPLACTAGSAADLFVAPTGTDQATGSQADPFATLERARDAIRALQGERPAGGVTVWVMPGLYPRTTAFTLETQDSGTADAPISYRAMESGKARILGGVLLSPDAFAPVTDAEVLARLDPAARAAVRQIDLRAAGVPEPGPEWTARFNRGSAWSELFLDGRRMTLARWPNEGWSRLVDATGGEPFDVRGTVGDKVGRFTYSGERPSRWLNEPDVWLHGYWFWDWSDQRQKVAAIDPAQQTLSLVPPHHYYGYRKNQRWYAFNALTELDSPGEWYVDRESWTLYFWPPADLAGHELGFSLLDAPLAKLTGVSHVTLAGLTFELSRGEGVQLAGGADNLVAGCTFRDLAKLAVRVEGGNRHRVQSCDLAYLGAGGISLSGGDRTTLTPAEHVAENNLVHHFAEVMHTYQNAIRLAGVGSCMRRNLVHDTVHEALVYSGNDHLVELNEVYNVCLEADDSGVIHQGRDWTWRGNVIRHNFFHHITAGSAVSNMGVYLDDMECGVEVYGNVLYRIPRAILVGGGRDNQVTNNLIIDCPISIHVDNRAMNWAAYHVGTTMKGLLDKVPYREEPWRTRYPALVDIWEDEPAVPKGNLVQRNLIVRSGDMALAAEVPKYGQVSDNLFLEGDPGFVDPGALDFRFRDFAAIQRQLPGFAPIPFEQIGLYPDAWRPVLPVGNPTLSPDGTSFVDAMTVTLSLGRGNRDADIHYTLDGSEPTAQSPLYREPLRLTDTTAVRAVAIARAGGEQSGVVGAVFTARHLGPGGGVSLLELKPRDVLAHGGLKTNRNYAGSGPVSLGGLPFAESLMLCPSATPDGGLGHATFDLTDGLEKATEFRATVGVDDAVKGRGSVVFQVEVLRGEQWSRVFESGVLTGGEAQAIAVPIAGVTALRLVTTDAGDNIHADHAVWGAPQVR